MLAMNWPKDVEVEVIFLPTSAGGRKTPVSTGYRGQFYYDGTDWDAVQSYPEVEQVNPGDTVRAYLAFSSPEAHLGKIAPGLIFLIREGNRVVGYGRVTRVIELEDSARRSSAKSTRHA